VTERGSTRIDDGRLAGTRRNWSRLSPRATVRIVTADGEDPDAAGPFLALAACGPLDGAVTVTAIPHGHGRCRLDVEWTEAGERHADHVEIDSVEDARIIAHEVANEMKAGHRPDLIRD
jgi:hypothetical protein